MNVELEKYMKTALFCYWRYIKRCPVVSMEIQAQLKKKGTGDRADIMAIKKNYIYQTEIKTNINDLKNDIKKHCHESFINKDHSYPAHFFLFAVPRDIEDEAKSIVKEKYPYAGLLSVYSHIHMTQPIVKTVIRPEKMNNPPANIYDLYAISNSMTNFICKILFKMKEEKWLNYQKKNN